jgi:putative ABC transport system ATP-binding protein
MTLLAADSVSDRIADPRRIAVRAELISKAYRRGATTVHALRDVSLAFDVGTFTSIMGPSGSGKSTLLHCLAGLDRPTSGAVHLAGRDLSSMNELELTHLRRRHVGFVFQAFNLLPALTVKQNILLPSRLSGHRPDRDWLRVVIDRTGLGDRLGHRPAELSGGQQQRVAIARALVMQPDVIYADEPTGALDTASGREILDLLREAVDLSTVTVVMVTHDPIAASYGDAVVFVADGSVVEEVVSLTAAEIAARMTRLDG